MVLSNILCALSFASSLLLNGACCYYYMHDEEERKRQDEDSIQRAIQAELPEVEHQRKEMKESNNRDVILHFQAQRRRKLMTQKHVGLREGNVVSLPTTICHRQELQSDFVPSFDPDYIMARRRQQFIDEYESTIPNQTSVSKTHVLHIGMRKRSGNFSLMDADSIDDDDMEEVVLE
jgi:hypothetical protein